MVLTHVNYLTEEELKEHRHEVFLIFFGKKEGFHQFVIGARFKDQFYTISIHQFHQRYLYFRLDRRCSHPLIIFSLQTQQTLK